MALMKLGVTGSRVCRYPGTIHEKRVNQISLWTCVGGAWSREGALSPYETNVGTHNLTLGLSPVLSARPARPHPAHPLDPHTP